MELNDKTPSARYIALVFRMRDRLGGVRGWQTRAARALGVHQTLISKIARSEYDSDVGQTTIEKAIARGIPRDVFASDVHLGDDALDALLNIAPPRGLAARASVLYADDIEGGLFVHGELPLCEDQTRVLELVLRWRGVLAELRPREREHLESCLEELLGHLTAAAEQFNRISAAFDDLSEQRRAREPQS